MCSGVMMTLKGGYANRLASIRWRSLVWAFAYACEQRALVLAGEREQPTVEDFLLELPGLELPA